MNVHDRLEELGDLYMAKPKGMTSDDALSEAAHAIYQDLVALLPESHLVTPFKNNAHLPGQQYKIGYNQALSDMQAKLSEYFKEKV